MRVPPTTLGVETYPPVLKITSGLKSRRIHQACGTPTGTRSGIGHGLQIGIAAKLSRRYRAKGDATGAGFIAFDAILAANPKQLHANALDARALR